MGFNTFQKRYRPMSPSDMKENCSLPLKFSECQQIYLSHESWLFEMINPFPNKPLFSCLCSTSLLKTLEEKEKFLVKSNFSFSDCFLPVWRSLCLFYQIWNCHLKTLSVWKSLKFVIRERVTHKRLIFFKFIQALICVLHQQKKSHVDTSSWLCSHCMAKT